MVGGCKDVVQVLLSLGADTDVFERSCDWWEIVNERNEHCVRELLCHGASIRQTNEKGQTLLMTATEKGLHGIVKICLEKGSESYANMVDVNGKNAVEYACENLKTACLEELLKNEKCSAMKASAVAACPKYYSGGEELVKKYCSELVKSPEDVPNKLEKELLQATQRAYYGEEAVLELVAAGADIWYTDDKGQNLLMIAAKNGNVLTVRQCMAKATFEKIHAVDFSGNTAIMLACQDQYRRRTDHLGCLLEILRNKESFKKSPPDKQV